MMIAGAAAFSSYPLREKMRVHLSLPQKCPHRPLGAHWAVRRSFDQVKLIESARLWLQDTRPPYGRAKHYWQACLNSIQQCLSPVTSHAPQALSNGDLFDLNFFKSWSALLWSVVCSVPLSVKDWDGDGAEGEEKKANNDRLCLIAPATSFSSQHSLILQFISLFHLQSYVLLWRHFHPQPDTRLFATNLFCILST